MDEKPRQVGNAAKHCQTTPVAGPSESEIMPLVSYRASVELVLRWEHSDQVVSGLRWEQREGQRSCCPQHEYSPGCAGNNSEGRRSCCLQHE